MLKSYFTAGLKALRRDFSYTLVNMLGLVVGMACCILLGLHLQHELGYDRHFAGHENIYRVAGESSAEIGGGANARVYFQVGEQLDRDFAEVQAAVRLTPRGRSLFRHDDVYFYWNDVYVADASVFSVFSHEVLQGNPDTALLEPGSIAVSESFARAYFGTADALGEVVTGESGSHTVKLVFADLPSNTHLQYDALLYRAPVDVSDRVFQIDYQKGGPLIMATDYTYVVLPPDYDPQAFAAVSDLYSERYLQRFANSLGGSIRYFLEPLADIHFGSTTQGDLPRGSRYFLYSFTGIALLVLLVACANYVNLTMVRFTQRDKEVQIRHVLGAGRASLILRFVLEAQVFVFLALPCAVLLLALLMELTPLRSIVGELQPLQTLLRPKPLLLLIGGTFVTGLLAGVYPALQQARGHFGKTQGVMQRGGNFRVRQFLLFLQFAISIGVVATTLLMYRQIRFVQDTPLGFAAGDRLVLEVRIPAEIDRLPALLNTLKAESSIVSATYSEEIPGRAYDIRPHFIETEAGTIQRREVTRQRVHDSWIDSMEIAVLEGRDFTAADFAVPDTEDSLDRKVMVNATLVRQMGWTQPIGKLIGGDAQVIGVVDDFRFQGTEQRVEPLVLSLDHPRWENKTAEEIAEQVRYVIVHHAPGALALAKERLQVHWRAFYPEQPFAFVMLEDFIGGLARGDDRQLSLVGTFGSLCILIAVLGLYSLTAFTTRQRGKEIAVRKVMGASAAQIMVLFTRGMLRLVILAGILASAVSAWVVSEWLQGFHYQQDLSLLVCFIATVLMSVLAVLTIAMQSLAAAGARPVLALRYE